MDGMKKDLNNIQKNIYCLLKTYDRNKQQPVKIYINTYFINTC